MKNITKILCILFVCLLITLKGLAREISAAYQEGQVRKVVSTLKRSVESTTMQSIISDEEITSKANFNSSHMREYLIEEPNNSYSTSSYSPEVLIKSLNNISNNRKDEQFNTLNTEELGIKITAMEHTANGSFVEESANLENSIQGVNMESATLENTLKDSQEEHMASRVLFINLLNPSTSIIKESNISSNKSENQISTTTVSKQPNRLLEEPATMLSNDNESQLASKPAHIENKSTHVFNTESSTPCHDNKDEELTLRPTNNPQTQVMETIVTSGSPIDQRHATESNQLATSQTDKLANPQDNESPTVSFLQTLITSSGENKTEEEKTTLKLRKTLEDYAVKQMNFILDDMLLESQQFVEKVLQATGNTIFQRDHLKRYAENIHQLLNPQQESNYGVTTDLMLVIQEGLYEEVVKKFDFFKSNATQQLHKHLPVEWLKDYKNANEELKNWLDKASNEMHQEFNLHLNEEEDHIKYLYFNEAFDDITRATEIHQKLALLADLIEIVKNKKQITFTDLYMQ